MSTETIESLTLNEKKFLKGYEIEPNEHGAYVFQSPDGNHLIALDMFLASYKDWLIENKLVKSC